MRKRGLTYVLAAMMLIGSTGIGGTSYVRADEPAITEEGEIATTETEEPTEEVTEEIIEEVTEEVTEEIAEETTEEVTEDTTEDSESDDEGLSDTDLIDVSDIDASEEDMAPADWYKDYEYELVSGTGNKRYIKLKKYIGTDKDVYLRKSARIGGKTFHTYLDLSRGENGGIYGSIFSGSYINSLRFESGFEFPEDSSYLFSDTYFKSIDFTGVDTSKVTTMHAMFYESQGFLELDLRSFDTSKVKDMSYMFSGTWAVESVDVSSFNTSNVTDMSYMFTAPHLESVDVSNFDTRNVTDMSGMFGGCSLIPFLDLSSFRTSNVKNFDGMLSSVRRVDISNFDFSSAVDASEIWGNRSGPDEIYAPINLKQNVKLLCDYHWGAEKYNKYFDSNGKEYTSLPKNSSKSIVLMKDVDFKNGWAEDWIGLGLRYYINNRLYDGPTRLTKIIIDGKEQWWVVNNYGYHDTTVTGLVQKITNGHLRFARNGVMDLTFTGLALDPQNHWRFVRNGIMDSTFTGIAQNTNGRWYYCKNGRIDTSFTNMIAKNTNGKYHYVYKGRPTSKITAIAYCPEKDCWYFCNKGTVDFKFSGKVAPCTNGNMYYVTKGKIDHKFIGIAPGIDGKKYYVYKGKVNTSYSGIYTYQGKKYKVVNGVVK